MRAVIQRVNKSKVTVDKKIVGEIKKGLMVLLGIGKDDNDQDIKYIADKIVNLRIFEDTEGKLNLSLLDIEGEILVVSQFTLYGDARKGRRPSFIQAGNPKEAVKLYEKFIDYISEYGLKIETGIFQADMIVSIENDGPVTILLDSKKNF